MAVAGLRRTATVVVGLFAPTALKPWLLRALGHPVAPGARIGASLLLIDRLAMRRGATVGAFNVLIARRIVLRETATIGTANVIKRRLSVSIAACGKIGNRNLILRGWTPRPVRPAALRLAEGATITSAHYLEMTESMTFGRYSTLAGIGSQMWTHGFVHDESGPGRRLVTGPIAIGDNVYLASRCIVNCGVRIGAGISVGAGACVSTSLEQPGVYVPPPLRFLDRRPDQRIGDLPVIEGENAIDRHHRRLP